MKGKHRKGKQLVMLDFRYHIILLFALLFHPYAYSASSIDIVVKQRVLIAQERGIITLPFTIVNQSSQTLHLTEKIDLPEGWRILVTKGAFILGGKKRTVRLVHVLAASDVPAGKYTIPYQVISQDQPTIHAEESINVVIKSNSKLTVEVINKPELVLAGEKFAIKVQVNNKGNMPVDLAVNVEDSYGYLTSFKPRNLHLDASQIATIIIHSRIPSTLKKTFFHTLKLSLSGQSISINKSIKTHIISHIPEGVGHYHSIPSRITTNYTNGHDEGTLQTEIVAAGSLGEQGKHHIDLLYRDTQTNSESSLGSDSEKKISYKNKMIDIHLGDHSFSVSGITDNGFYGEGAEIHYHPENKKWNIRAFGAKQRKSDLEEVDTENDRAKTIAAQVSGIEIDYKFENDVQLALNMMAKENIDNNQKKETIMGADLYWDQYSEAEINLSYAKDEDGQAFRFQQNGKLGELSYDLEVQNADTQFDGRIKDVKSENLTGIYFFNEDKNYLRGNLFHAKRNLEKVITQQIPEEINISVGIGHYLNSLRQDSLFTEVFRRDKKDQREISELDHIEQGIRLDYQKNINKQLGLNTILEYAHKNNKITKKKNNKNRGSLTLAYTPTDKYDFGFNIDSLQTDSNQQESLSYGLNAAVHFTSKQHLSGYWRHSDDTNNKNDTFQLSYNHTFNNGISIGASVSTDTLNINEAQEKGDDDLDYLLRVTIPFNTPLYKYSNIASIKGKVIDTAQQPINNVIVGIAGQYAITDKQGNYLFKAIQQGEYEFTTDLTKTHLNNYLIEDEKQRTTTLTANQTTSHNITLAQGTGIIGQVLSYATSQGSLLQSRTDKIKPSGGIENLLVTLLSTENTKIVHKVLTSEGGFFSFNGIKAGQWLIQVTDPQKVIKDARLDKPQRTLKLKVGEEQSLVFRAIPLIKKIKKIGPSSGFSIIGE